MRDRINQTESKRRKETDGQTERERQTDGNRENRRGKENTMGCASCLHSPVHIC